MSLNAIILSLFGRASLSQSIRSIIMQFGLFVLPIIFYYCVIIDKMISYKNFINVFMIFFWINLIVGFIAYIGQLFDITIINNIFDFFSNLRAINTAHNGTDILLANAPNSYTAFGLPRLDNLNEEPGHYAQFLFLFLPFALAFSGIKSPIINNAFLNVLIKRTILPFFVISIILTLSPIFLILTIVLIYILFLDKIFILLKKYFYVIIIGTIIALIIICSVDFSNTYLSRITNIFVNVRSFEDFIDVEQSLASRVVCYINSFCIFLKHPLLGIGHGNLAKEIVYQYVVSPVPLTPEIFITTSVLSEISEYGFLLRGFIYVFLAENGIFIFLILVYFYYKLIKNIDSIQKRYRKNDCVYKYGWMIKGTLCAVIINSFYNLNFLYINLHFIYALCIMYIYEYGVKTKIWYIDKKK